MVEAVARKQTYEGGHPYYEAMGVTSGQQHGPTHDSEPPDAVARPSRRRRSRRHRENNLLDGKYCTTMLYLGSGWGFFGGGVAGGGCEVVAFVFSRAGPGVWACRVWVTALL